MVVYQATGTPQQSYELFGAVTLAVSCLVLSFQSIGVHRRMVQRLALPTGADDDVNIDFDVRFRKVGPDRLRDGFPVPPERRFDAVLQFQGLGVFRPQQRQA